MQRPEPCTKKLILAYFTSDDGIWATCESHEWERNLGFDGTIDDLEEAQRDHDNSNE